MLIHVRACMYAVEFDFYFLCVDFFKAVCKNLVEVWEL